TQRRLATRTRALHFDFERPDAMLRSLTASVFGANLCGIRSRLTRPLETHHTCRGPADRIALRVGDGDHGVVEARVHMRDASGNVLPLALAQTLGFPCHVLYPYSKSGCAGRHH